MRIRKTALAVILLLLGAALAQGKKYSDDVPTSGVQMVKVIIQFRGTPIDKLIKKLTDKGGQLNKKFKNMDSVVVSLPAFMIPLLDADPDIQYITPDRPLKRHMEFANPTVGANIARQYGFEGNGVAVAVIDSGVYAHEDLAAAGGGSRIVYSESFVPGDTRTTDGYGHGTHVAGIIAGNATMSTGLSAKRTFRGIAPKAKIVNLRVLDGAGAGSDSGVIAAIDRAIDLKNLYNIRIINLSLGRLVYESFQNDPLCQAVERAWRCGRQ
jgi:serine protease AprX